MAVHDPATTPRDTALPESSGSSEPARAQGNRLEALAHAWSELPAGLRWTIWIGAAFLLLLARRPETLTQAQFLNEDGQVFFVGTFFGSPLEALLRPYAGYLHLVPRLVGFAERLAPISWAPFVGNAIALLITACVAAYVASDRLADAVPDRRLRWAIGALILLLPASTETLGSITYVQWYLGIYLVAASLATPPATAWQRLADRATLIVTGLTGPLSIFLAPLYWARVWLRRDRDSWWLAACVTAAAAMQAFVYLVIGPQVHTPLPDLIDALRVAGTRMVAEPLLGPLWSLWLIRLHLPFWVGVAGICALAGMLVAVARRLPRWSGLWLLYAWAVIGAAGIWRSMQFGLRGVLEPGIAERYFLVPGATVGILVLAGVAMTHDRSRWPALFLGALLMFAVVGGFRLLPWTPHDWAGESACIGGPAPCVVPVAGTGWDIYWPGRGGTYVQSGVP